MKVQVIVRPSLPFTFNELKNIDIPKQVDETKGAQTQLPEVDPQQFLRNAVNEVKTRFGTADGLIDSGLALNPVTRYVDMTSKFFGGPGVAEGFKEGVTKGDEVVVPPMPF